MRDYHDNETLDRDRDRQDFRRRRSSGAFFGSDEDEAAYRRNEGSTFRRSPGRDRSERNPRFGTDVYREGLARDETRRLIASDKVEGTPIYDRNGRRLGSIHNLMLDKMTGEVVYAVVRHRSGFLGLDQRHFPLDWCELAYDTGMHGYEVDFTEEDLERRLRREESRRSSMEGAYGGYENYRPRFYW